MGVWMCDLWSTNKIERINIKSFAAMRISFAIFGQFYHIQRENHHLNTELSCFCQKKHEFITKPNKYQT